MESCIGFAKIRRSHSEKNPKRATAPDEEALMKNVCYLVKFSPVSSRGID